MCVCARAASQAEVAETRTYAERFPPYQPVSLKNDKGLGTLRKKAGDIDKDPRGVFAELCSYYSFQEVYLQGRLFT